MKLGIQIPLEFYTASEAVQAAQYAEKVGLDHVVVNDHLRLPGGPRINEAWTVLASMGAVTERIRLGPCVSPIPLRPPYLLAKMAATVDQLTNGRLMMGVGAGWHREEFDWVGTPFLPHSKRFTQTEEGLQLLQSYWTDKVTTFHGTYYKVDNVTVEPKPVQKPHPPFFLGGGSIRVLELTATYGQGWMPFAPSITGLARRLRVLKEMLDLTDRRPSDLEIIPSVLLQLGKSKQEAKRQLPKWGKPPDESRAILGTPSDCLARIHEYAEAGVTHLALRLLKPSKVEKDINIIVQEILPKL